ncbi:MAG: DUF1080 domain-containing protein [Gemmatimonadota bacterium]
MTGRRFSSALAGLLLAGLSPRESVAQDAGHAWKIHDLARPTPRKVVPGREPGQPPSDAVVLFDGQSLDGWTALDGSAAKWVVHDGYMQTVPGAGPIVSKHAFGDVQAHIEWATPSPGHGEGQDRGNSGVYFMGLYEVQVLDSYENVTYADGQAAALYGQHPPLVNAARAPGEWQTYDVVFRRPRFRPDGAVRSPTKLTVFHNGVLVQDNAELWGPTAWLQFDPYVKHADALPFTLQDHDHPVRFRNFWVRPLADPPADERGPRASRAVVRVSVDVLDRYVGSYGVGKDRLATVTRQGTRLFIDPFGRGVPLELVPQSTTRFDFLRTAGTVEFASGAGKSPRITVKVAGIDRALERLP